MRKKPTAARTLITPTDQEGINSGQRQINGQLCRVDRKIVEILRLLRLELAKLPEFAALDFAEFDTRLKEIYHISADVAEIIPPGCEPQYNPNPNWPFPPPTTP
jgi:hypothetical protein